MRLHGVRQAPDVDALAGLDDRALSILIWHYHDVDLPGEPATVELNVRSLPSEAASVLVEHFRIDTDHSNAHTEWKKWARPPGRRPIRSPRSSVPRCWPRSSLPTGQRLQGGSLRLPLVLPRQAVSLISHCGGDGEGL